MRKESVACSNMIIDSPTTRPRNCHSLIIEPFTEDFYVVERLTSFLELDWPLLIVVLRGMILLPPLVVDGNAHPSLSRCDPHLPLSLLWTPLLNDKDLWPLIHPCQGRRHRLSVTCHTVSPHRVDLAINRLERLLGGWRKNGRLSLHLLRERSVLDGRNTRRKFLLPDMQVALCDRARPLLILEQPLALLVGEGVPQVRPSGQRLFRHVR